MADVFDPPWRLDPLKNIVEVGWGGSRALMIICFYEQNEFLGQTGVPPPVFATISEFPAGQFQEQSLFGVIGPQITSPSPPTDEVARIAFNEMKAINNAWCFPPRIVSEQEVIEGQTYTFIERGLYRDMLNQQSELAAFYIDYVGNSAPQPGFPDRPVFLIEDLTTIFTAGQIVGFVLIEIVSSHEETGATRIKQHDLRVAATFFNVPRIKRETPLENTMTFNIRFIAPEGSESFSGIGIDILSWRKAGTFTLANPESTYDITNDKPFVGNAGEFIEDPGAWNYAVTLDIPTMLITSAVLTQEA